jgi:hypothetical protein
MGELYDKERTVALIKEARQLTADLKIETEKIRIQMTRVLLGEDELSHASEGETVTNDADFFESDSTEIHLAVLDISRSRPHARIAQGIEARRAETASSVDGME